MSISIDDLKPAPLPAVVEAEIGGTIRVRLTYDAAAISAAWLQRAASLPRLALAEVLLTWDVTASNGDAIAPPPDAPDRAERWARILEPLSIRGIIEPMVAAIIDDWRGGGKVGGGSGAGS